MPTATTHTPAQRELLEAITCPEQLATELEELAVELLGVQRALRPTLVRAARLLIAEDEHFAAANVKLEELGASEEQRRALSDGLSETSPARFLRDELYALEVLVQAAIGEEPGGAAVRAALAAEGVSD